MGIELWLFPPNATHVVQPLDIGVFGPLKSRLESLCHDWHNDPANAGKQLGRYGFMVSVAYKAFERTFKTPGLVSKAFARAGLVPWRPNDVDLSRLKPSQVYQTSHTDAAGGGAGETSAIVTGPNASQSSTTACLNSVPGAASSTIVSAGAGPSSGKSTATGCLNTVPGAASHSSTNGSTGAGHSSGQSSAPSSSYLNTAAGFSQGMTAAALDTPQLEDGPSASVLTGEAAGDPAAAPMLLGGGDKTLRQLDLRKEMRYELDDEIESVSVSDGAVSLVSEAAAAKLVARQVSLTLAEAEQKLRRFELTQDLNDIAMFEMLYEKKIFDVENNDYKAWAGYKRASEPAFERYSAQCSSVMCNR